MSARFNLPKIIKKASVAALVAASTLAYAGSTIKVTNNSKQPWCLRISEEPSVPIMAQDIKGEQAFELSAEKNKLMYQIQPGETCILQFRDFKDLPVKKDIGLVDRTGAELGALKLETKSAPLYLRVANFLGGAEDDRLTAYVSAETKIPNVLHTQGTDCLSIDADTWQE